MAEHYPYLMKSYHLVKEGDDWKLKKEGAERATEVYPNATKEEALKHAAKTLKDSGSTLKVHLESGAIQEERTYPRAVDPPGSPG